MEKRTGNLDAVGAGRKAGGEGRPQDAGGAGLTGVLRKVCLHEEKTFDLRPGR